MSPFGSILILSVFRSPFFSEVNKRVRSQQAIMILVIGLTRRLRSVSPFAPFFRRPGRRTRLFFNLVEGFSRVILDKRCWSFTLKSAFFFRFVFSPLASGGMRRLYTIRGSGKRNTISPFRRN